MGTVPHQEPVFLLLRDREQLGSIIDDKIDVVLRNGGVGQIQKSDVYEGVSELVQELWTGCRISGEGVVQNGDGRKILIRGHPRSRLSLSSLQSALAFEQPPV